jgi:transposase
LADWLAACGITTVALESPGVEWIPLVELLECRGLEVLVVDPPQGPKIKGRPKSAGHDGQWRQRRQTFGLLAGAFRPPEHGCVRRSDLRQRALFLSSASPHIQPRPTALTQMHLKRQHVVRDVTGETGMALIRAMLAGERDPVPWARRRHDRGHHDEETLAKALHGQWRAAHLCAWAQAVAL